MYRKHKVMLVLITICCGIISFMFKVSYSIIASDGITVNSIVWYLQILQRKCREKKIKYLMENLNWEC